MHLTLHTDYGLRVLLYLAHYPDRRVNTREVSAAFGISKNHLVRVVQTLAENNFVTTTIGRGGGIALAKQPDQIRVSEVVRALEPNLHMVECFNLESNTCPIVPVCGLKAPLRKALDAFLGTLDKYTLADIVQTKSANRFTKLLLPA
jgi:Rrf2 family nitric oxide-sensitive transcriptional repressor